MSVFGTFSAPFTKNDHPDEIVQLHFGPYSNGSGATAAAGGEMNITGLTVPMFVTDREIDIEAITVRAVAAGTAHSVQFWRFPSGTAITGSASPGYVLHSTSGLLADADDLTANTALTVSLNDKANSIPAGSVICIRGEASLDTMTGLMVTVRVKNRAYRTNDAGEKVWITPQPE